MVVIDPLGPGLGLTPFRGKVTHAILTNPTDRTMSHVSGLQGEGAVITSAGEYSFAGLTVRALPYRSAHGIWRSIVRLTLDSLNVVHLGALDRDLSASELSELEQTEIHLLLLPIGGGSGLSLRAALRILAALEPRVVIPVHYQLPALTEKLDTVESFAKEVGLHFRESLPKVILKASKLPAEERQAYIVRS